MGILHKYTPVIPVTCATCGNTALLNANYIGQPDAVPKVITGAASENRVPVSQESYTYTQDVQIARPKPAKALPVSTDDLTYIRKRVSSLQPDINLYQSIGFLFYCSALACFLQSQFGTFTRVTPSVPTTNEIVLWCMTGFCLLAAIGSFVFCCLRYKDCKKYRSDLVDFLNVLESEIERFNLGAGPRVRRGGVSNIVVETSFQVSCSANSLDHTIWALTANSRWENRKA